MRKTKIVCTLGPATNDLDVLRQLMTNGMNVARINFSHGDHEEHAKRIGEFKKLREELGLPIALLLDTKGPEIRIKDFAEGSAEVKTGSEFVLTAEDVEGDDKKVSVTYKNLPRELSAGTRILIDDGLIELEVKDISDNDIICRVINGGRLSNKKSINIPGVSIKMPYMSERDRDDIIFGIGQDVDYIAASFVRTAYDVMEIRKILDENNGHDIQIIAKNYQEQWKINMELQYFLQIVQI